MDIIELDKRVAQEVFEDLKYRLESTSYLPDEYFLMDSEWENGRTIPKGANIFCTTDCGASEGVYLDVYLKWYENQQPVTKSFITGKTLGGERKRHGQDVPDLLRHHESLPRRPCHPYPVPEDRRRGR